MYAIVKVAFYILLLPVLPRLIHLVISGTNLTQLKT